MLESESQNKDEYENVIRRDTFWSGLVADLVIEHTLMHTLKTDGGLTLGEGYNEAQRER